MNTKHTAVEWLRKKLFDDFGFAFSDNIFEQAKAMEKEQMIKFCQTWEDGSIEDTKTDLYNSIYGGKK
jgi:hypothetical protein